MIETGSVSTALRSCLGYISRALGLAQVLSFSSPNELSDEPLRPTDAGSRLASMAVIHLCVRGSVAKDIPSAL